MQGQNTFGLCCLFCPLPYILLHEKEPVQEAGIKDTAFLQLPEELFERKGRLWEKQKKRLK